MAQNQNPKKRQISLQSSKNTGAVPDWILNGDETLQKLRSTPTYRSYPASQPGTSSGKKDSNGKTRAQRRAERKANRNSTLKFLDSLFGMKAAGSIYRVSSIILFLIASTLFMEDYLTSVYGYQMIPTQKALGYLAWVVGMLPQVGQIVFAYQYKKTRQVLFILITLFLMLADITTDVYFKSAGFTFGVFPAIAESILLFTMFSEIFMMVAIEGLRDTFSHWGF